MGLIRPCLAAAALVIVAAPSSMAADATATPETLADLVHHARAGDSLTLAAGEYRGVRISDCKFDPAVTLEAAKATFFGLVISDCDGLTLNGGEFRLPPTTISQRTGKPIAGMALRLNRAAHIVVRSGRFVGPGHPDTGDGIAYGEGKGLAVIEADGLVVEDSSFTGFVVAIALTSVDNFRISRITSTAMASDGVQVAGGHHGVIEYVQCSATAIRDKEHPDCIQAWSLKDAAPTSDIVVRHNSVVGNTQGISFFKGTGGFDRITIEDNDVSISYPDGITLHEGRDSVVRRNHVRTLAGSKYHAKLLTTGAKACGNVVEPGANRSGYSDGKC